MPHDIKGRLIEVGDTLKVPKGWGETKKAVGIVNTVHPGSDTCNVTTSHISEYCGIEQKTSNAGECELVLKADGSEPVEPQSDGVVTQENEDGSLEVKLDDGTEAHVPAEAVIGGETAEQPSEQ